MKKNIIFFYYCLFILMGAACSLTAQTNVHQGSPTSFMYLQGQPWVEPKYGTSYNSAPTTGVQGLTTTTD